MNEIEKFKEKIDFVELVSDYTRVKRSGKNYMALCPFHEEKTPSLSIDPDAKLFHCFGCGKSGDIIKFVMEIESLSFSEAVEFLSKKYNIPSPKISKKTSKIENEIYALNELIADYYTEKLFSEEGRETLNYLKERGIKENTIREFKLGYVPEDFSELRKIVSEFPKRVLQMSGNFYYKGETLLNRFSGRLSIPIFNVSGRIIAFAGRSLKGETPKYKNSPETALYRKSQTLYGLNLTKSYIRKEDEAILVEGYFDLISLYQEGVKNVVGSMGTSLTEKQVFLLKKFTDKVLFFYDFDEAGINAMKKSFPLFIKSGIFVSIFKGDRGLDPDEFIKKHKKEGFSNRKKESFSIRKLFFSEKKEPLKIKRIVEELIEILKLSEDTLYIEEMINLIHSYSGYSIEILKEEVNKKHREKERQFSNNYNKEKVRLSFKELVVLKFLLKNGDAITEEFLNYYKNSSDFIKENMPVLFSLINFIVNNREKENFWDMLEDNFKKDIVSLLYKAVSNEEIPDNFEDVIGVFKKFKEQELSFKLKSLNKEIEKASNHGEKDILNELLKRKIELVSQLKTFITGGELWERKRKKLM